MSNTAKTNTNASGTKQAENQTRISLKEQRKQIELQAKKDAKKAHKAATEGTAKNADQTSTKEKKDKDLKTHNLDAAAAKVTKEKTARESKYNYPEGTINNPQKQKEFRRKARAAKESFIERIKTLEQSNKKEDKAQLESLQAEYSAWEKATYANPQEN